MNAYLTEKSSLLASAETILGVVGNTSAMEARLDVLTSEMNALAKQIQNIISENASTPFDQKTYLERYNSMASEFNAKEAEFNNTELEISGKKAREVQIRNFVETIREMDAPITEFDSGLWCGLVDYVTVYGRDSIKVKFKDGTEI